MAIKAFLGHSFTDDDKDLVIEVTEFLDAQKVGHPEFEWVHATQAKPMGVVEKVLPLIRESDIFIGICTRKERVVSPGDLKRSFWNHATVRAPADKVGWKTSDWIIQEIGIAIQREMTLILLLEDDVREPGGLIGDLEYIPFSRGNLAPAFTRLTQMLGGALQRSSPSLGVSDPPAQTTEPQEQLSEVDANDPTFEDPKPSWDADTYEHALFRGVFLENKEYEERIFKAFLDSPFGKTVQTSNKWHATREYFLLVQDKGGNLVHLETLVNKDRSNPEMIRMLARAHLHLGNRDIGASLYEEAAAAAGAVGLMLDQASFLSTAVDAYTKIGRTDEAERVLRQLNALEPSSPELEAVKLKSAGVIAAMQDQTVIRIAALERRIALNPTDIDDRFMLAHLYGEIGDHESSLFHYLAIPESKRESGTWNNLGVARERVKIKIGAVDAYRRAEELGNTLAMSNLALEFISAGFAKEAEALCTTALAKPEYDPRVPETLAGLKTEAREESEKEEAIVQKVGPRSRFLRDAGQSMTLSLPKIPTTEWTGPNCGLTLSLANDSMKLSGVYEVKASGLGLMMGLGLPNLPPDNYVITYEGTVRGRVFFVKVIRRKVGAATAATLLTESNPDSAVMILSDDGCKLRVMERIGSTPKFYDITAL